VLSPGDTPERHPTARRPGTLEVTSRGDGPGEWGAVTVAQPVAEVAAADPVGDAAARRQIMIVLPGLMLALVLAMLDQVIVGTALPRIVGDLGGVAHLSWVVTAYVLASTITTPLYGKLGDLYGRKKLLMTAIVIFLVGSVLAGQSHSMAELIAFRAIQGLGAGGLMVGVLASIGDLVSPRERGQYVGYMMAVMMVAMIAGPLVGGTITDNFSWRWIFYINIPVGGLALVYLAVTLHTPRNRIRHKIDYLGAALIAVAATALVLVTSWGGTQYAWSSPQIIWLAVTAVAALAGFCAVETRAAEPVLPLHLFANRNFSIASVMSFLAGFAMFGAVTFLPLYQQTVQGASATSSGLLLLPMMAGAVVTSMISGQVTTRTGRYKIFPIIGGGAMAVGMYLLSLLGVGTSRTTSALYMVVLGIGMGFLMQITTLIVQNSVQPRDMGVASSTRTFFQMIGGSFGVSLFGAIFASRFQSVLRARLPGVHVNSSGGQFDPLAILRMPLAVRHDVYYAIAHAIHGVFIWAVPIAGVVFVIGWFIKEVPLRGREPGPEPGGGPAAEPGAAPAAEPAGELSTVPVAEPNAAGVAEPGPGPAAERREVEPVD
jgi:EmrB/QacA subfamily drug resistance transporter